MSIRQAYKLLEEISSQDKSSSKPMCSPFMQAGLPVTVETCPHYLNYVSEDIPEGDTRFKCAPPIRGPENQAALWEGLLAGHIDSLASDHSPAPPDMKLLEAGDFRAAWGGIAGSAHDAAIQLFCTHSMSLGQPYRGSSL